MKIVALIIIVYVLVWHTTAFERLNLRPPSGLIITPTAESTVPVTQGTTPVTTMEKSLLMKALKIDDMKKQTDVDLEAQLKAAQDLKSAQMRNFTSVIFILIMMLLAGFDIIYLQMMFKKDFKSLSVAIVSVTSFIVAMNFMVFMFILRAIFNDL